MHNYSGRITFLFSLAAAVALNEGSAHGQSITIDGRLSPAQTLAGPNYAIGPGLGRQVGGNLFHSFGAFGLNQGESATFSGPSNVNNVIGRVTGGAASSINGRVSSTVPGANLYLVNPAGVVFGPNASVDVSGSFHASSADYLRLKDGARFQATNPNASTLSAAPPEAFGFLSANPRPVNVNGSNLQLPTGGGIGLVGGPVTISGGVLLAPAGTIQVGSAAGPGEIPVNPRAAPPSVARSGTVRVENNSTLYPSGGGVYIHAGELSVSGAGTTIVTDSDIPGPGGGLSLHGDRSVTISDRATVVASATRPGSGPGIRIGTAAGGTVTLNSLATVATNAPAASDGGAVAISAGTLTLQSGAVVTSNATGRGNGGPISVTARSTQLDGMGTSIGSKADARGLVDANGLPTPAGTAGTVNLTGGTLSVQNRATIEASTSGSGAAGTIDIAMTGDVTVAAGSRILSNSNLAGPARGGNGGMVRLSAGTLTLSRGGSISADTQGSGNAGAIALNVGGPLVIDGTGRGEFTNGVSSEAAVDVAGSAGSVRVNAGSVAIVNGGFVNSNTRGTGAGGSVLVTTPGALLLDGGPAGGGFTEIGVSALGPRSGDAGTVAVNAGTAVVRGGAAIRSSTVGLGRGGDVAVSAGSLALSRGGSISADTQGSGNAGAIALNVGGPLVIDGTGRGEFTNGVSSEAAVDVAGSAGSVRVNAGSVAIVNGGFVNSNTRGTGAGGSVLVTTLGALLLDGGPAGGGFTEIGVSALGLQSGDAGTVTVNAGSVAVQGGAAIRSSTAGPGRGGNVAVNAGALTLSRGGAISTDASMFGSTGDAGDIALAVAGPLVIDGTGRGGFPNGVSSEAAVNAAGSAGSVRVSAGSVAIANGGFFNSNTRGTGAGGSVVVSTPGALLLDGGPTDGGFTEIGASALGPRSGDAGMVTVNAGLVAVQGGARIASATAGPGRGGTVAVNAGTLALSSGASINTQTEASGNAGVVALNVAGNLSVDGASAVSSEALPRSSGSAGAVQVNAGNLSILNGGTISSSTRSTGAGGSVLASTPGALLLDGRGVPGAAITAATYGAQSGDGGTVTVSAGKITILDAAQIASSSTGQGRGGNVNVAASSTATLDGAGPQINATSTGAGPAGSIAVSAPRLSLRNGASISTEARAANGGDITIGPGDLLYLQRSSIASSVDSAFGNGGNITVDPRLVVLDRSLIQANAVGGNGGNLFIQARQLVSSAESAVTATSQLGVSGEIFITAQPLNLNGALVVLASDLRSAAALLREGCAARGANPRSSLLMAGHGGQRQAVGTTVPALYFVGRPLPVETGQASAANVAPERTSIELSSGCD